MKTTRTQTETMEIFFIDNISHQIVDDAQNDVENMAMALRKGTRAQRDFEKAAALIRQANELIGAWGKKYAMDGEWE